MNTFICPDCHCVHTEPPEASYLLAVRCFDCALALEYHDGFYEPESVAEAA